MKLFKYEGYKLNISEEAMLLKPFRDIWKRDKTASKDKALMELGYVYFMADPRSDYQFITDIEERKEAIKEGEGILPKWEPDKLVTEAISFYETFKPTSALLLEDTRIVIDKVRAQLKDIDLEALDEKGKPIYTLSSIIAAVKQIPGLIKDLDEAEKTMASEMKNQGKMRGQGEKTILEDELDI